jgi:hypothetical protein
MPRVRTQNDDGSKANIEYVSASAGVADADKFIRTGANGLIDPSLVDLSGAGLAMQTPTLVAVLEGQAIAKTNTGAQDTLQLANATDGLKPCFGFATADQATPGALVTWKPLVGEITVVQASSVNADYYLGLTDGQVTTNVSAYTTGNGIQKVGRTSATTILNALSEDIEIIA